MKRFLSFLIVFCLICSSINIFGFTTYYEDGQGNRVKLSDFIDTQGHWAHDQILKWADYDIIKGNNGSFMPDNPIIRGDLAIIFDRMMDLKNMTYNYFSDLYSEDYYRESLLKCVAEGYINGIGNNQINPRGYATREEVAVILCRVFKIDTSYSGNTGFKDDSDISSWAKSSVYALNRLGYLNGTPDGKVNPKSNITRAEMITLLNNFADTYIAKKDNDGSGTTFVSNFPKNLVVCRNIDLQNSTVGRDVYLTKATTLISFINTTIRGKLVVLDKVNITLDNATISQIYLNSGKSNISGVSDSIEEIYVCEFASESTFDTFPKKLILEPGVRVSINGLMYENNTARIKTYNGDSLRTELAEEQGYIVGGPRILNGVTTLHYNNVLEMTGITVTEGDSEIREVGIVWIESDKDEEPINPTYKKNDGRKRYTGAYHVPFDFELEDVDGYCTYRLYVKDKDGLYAYGAPITLEAYDFSINLEISDENYPKKLQADVILRGSNVPRVLSVQIVHAETDLYSESLSKTPLLKYVEQDVENPIDEKTYLRYTGVIDSPTEYVDRQEVYYPPTAFGYIIKFFDYNIINRFPVLSNVIPEGIDPVNTLEVGSVIFGDNRLTIKDSKVVTNLVSVEEVGIAYKESSSSSMSKPSGTTSGWTRISGGRNLDIKQTYTFNTNIPITDTSLNTFYVPYVKTSNGYFYGEVSKVENNWFGEEGGPRITGEPIVTVLSENSAVIQIPYNTSIDLDNTSNLFLSALKNGVNDSSLRVGSISSLDGFMNGSNLFIYLDNLEKDSAYSLNLRLKNLAGLSSNVVNVNFNTTNMVGVRLINKTTQGGNIKYIVDFPEKTIYTVNSCNLNIGSQGSVRTSMEDSDIAMFVAGVENTEGVQVVLNCSFFVSRGTAGYKSYPFTRIVTLY